MPMDPMVALQQEVKGTNYWRLGGLAVAPGPDGLVAGAPGAVTGAPLLELLS